jgi:NTE family protein
MSANGEAPRVAVVLPGGGVRGAYEAGALSELLPALEQRGEHVSIYCGTSVGAINAAVFSSRAHHPVADQVDQALEHWRGMRKSSVIRPVVGPRLGLTALRYLGDMLELPGVRLSGLLDPAPLKASLERWVDWLALHRNVRERRVHAVSVVASSLSRGRPVAFVETRGPLPPRSAGEDLRFLPVRLSAEHIRASAAIPLLFPPVEVTAPVPARGHYLDGGTRLNTPIKPALALGADRVIVIGFEPFAASNGEAPKGDPPRLSDVAANVIDGLLVDQVGDDIQRLVAINSFFSEHAAGGPSPAARAYRRSRGRPPYRRVSYALVAPERRGELGEIADRVFRERYGGLNGLRSPDFPFLTRVMGGRTRSRGELLSFLLFDPLFVHELIELGRRDARRWLDRHPGFWCTDPEHDFELDPEHLESARDEHTLDEWRRLRRM